MGQPDRRLVDAALAGLASTFGREVNVTYVGPARWRSTDDPFVRTVRSRPLVTLEMSDSPKRLDS